MDITTYNDVDFNQSFFADPLIDLTGLNVYMMVRRKAADPTIYLNLNTLSGGIAVPIGTDGAYSIFIFQSSLQKLPLGAFEFSIVATDGVTRTQIGRGTLTNNAGATRF